MKKNARYWPCYYFDGERLIHYKDITYRDSIDYAERMYDKGFILFWLNSCFILFRKGKGQQFMQ